MVGNKNFMALSIRHATWLRINRLKDGHNTFDMILNDLIDLKEKTTKETAES